MLEPVFARNDELRVTQRQGRTRDLRRAGRPEPGMPGTHAFDRVRVAVCVRIEQGSGALAQQVEAGTGRERERGRRGGVRIGHGKPLSQRARCPLRHGPKEVAVVRGDQQMGVNPLPRTGGALQRAEAILASCDEHRNADVFQPPACRSNIWMQSVSA